MGPRLHAVNLQGGSEYGNVVGVAGQDRLSQSLGAEGHVGVNNVTSLGGSKKQSNSSGVGCIQRDNVDI